MSQSSLILKESKEEVRKTQRDYNRQFKEFRKKFKKKRRPKTTAFYWYLAIGLLSIIVLATVLIYLFYDFLTLNFISAGS
jgi:uncharacterized membrane protein YukC